MPADPRQAVDRVRNRLAGDGATVRAHGPLLPGATGTVALGAIAARRAGLPTPSGTPGRELHLDPVP